MCTGNNYKDECRVAGALLTGRAEVEDLRLRFFGNLLRSDLDIHLIDLP